MRILNSIAAMALACAAGTAAADPGLRVDGAGGFWYGTQTRLSVHAVRADATPVRLGYQTSAGLSGIAPMAAAVSGDYYFSKDLADATSPRTGFRASSVLLIRQPGISLSDLAWSSRAAVSFGTSHGVALPSLFPGLVDSSADNASAMPYLGIGYSDVSLKTGWGFWADIGLVVQNPANALGLGRVMSGNQGVEDLIRELRMAPMVQLGVSYSF
jgi:hypothetical protein